jgi:hypothetical protein
VGTDGLRLWERPLGPLSSLWLVTVGRFSRRCGSLGTKVVERWRPGERRGYRSEGRS